MKKSILALLLLSFISQNIVSQEKPLTPENNPFNSVLIKNETSDMVWYALNDTAKVEIGKIKTEIKKEGEKVLVITTVIMPNTQSKWVDSTLAYTKNLKPIYHSSHNQQRDMVLDFDKIINGYYLDKNSGTTTIVSENPTDSYFDSNIYPQLIRWLPLTKNYSPSISIFDYNPSAKIGVLTATIKNVQKGVLTVKEEQRKIWKVTVTDGISDNKAVSTYYIDRKTRDTLRQEIDFQGRKMVMELT